MEEASQTIEDILSLPGEGSQITLWNQLHAAYIMLRSGLLSEAKDVLLRVHRASVETGSSHLEANTFLLLSQAARIENDPASSGEYSRRFWGLVDAHGFRFMPASDSEITLWAERERSSESRERKLRRVALMAPVAHRAVVDVAREQIRPGVPRPLVEIETLGPLQVTVRGQASEEVWKSRLKAKRFFEILLSHRSLRVSADEAAEYLWPSVHPQKGQHRLENTGSNLRKVFVQLGAEGHLEVKFEFSFYCLYCSEQVRITHQAFQALAERGLQKHASGHAETAKQLLSEAAGLYTNTFLEDAPYERFADDMRQHLSDLQTECLHALAGLPQMSEEESLTWWQKAVEHDPYDEEAYQEIIEMCLQIGHKSKALKYLAMIEERMTKELELPLPAWAQEIAALLKA